MDLVSLVIQSYKTVILFVLESMCFSKISTLVLNTMSRQPSKRWKDQN